MILSGLHSVSAPAADSFHWYAIYNKFPDVFEIPLGLLPEINIKPEINLLDPNAPIQNYNQYW